MKKIKMNFTPKEQFQGFLATPEIFVKNAIFEYPLYHTKLEISGDQLPEVSKPTESVLGKQMEHFFACYVEHFTSEEILIRNKQIIEDKKTLGELDFLLKDTASEAISHIELVFKFYLFDPNTGTSELDHLIGPNKRDSLNKKLGRLQKGQFPLLFREATQKILSTHHLEPQDIVQKMCFKASVFLPKQLREVNFEKINPQAVAGFWIKASEFTFEAYGKNTFFSPKKIYWPVLPSRNKTWFSFAEIEEQIRPLLDKKFAPLLWMKTPNGKYERFFIVWW